MLNGFFHPTPWQLIALILFLTHITIISVTIYLHRFSAHRAISLHPAVQHFFRFWLWLTTGMVTRHWTAIHRKHHDKCETDQDPHSPQILGIKEVFWRGAELYHKESRNQETLSQYGKGTPDDWLERNLYSKSDRLGVTLLLLTEMLLLGPIGLTVWAIQMMWIPVFAAGVINGIGHYWGYRNFECADASRNLIPWGILIGGEELHNNHHTYPNSAKLSCKWWEFDIGWFYIKLLSLLGLAKINRVPPKPVRIPGKYDIDFDTLYAVVMNRFQVMAQYRKTVVAPLVATEKLKAQPHHRDLFHRAKSLICRECRWLDDACQSKLEALLDVSHNLQVIYNFRLRLQQIWEKTSSNKTELLHALAQWCKEAEATGIQALADFSQILRSYTLSAQPVKAQN